MKKLYSLILFVGLIFNSHAQVLNGSFEASDSVASGYLPSDWNAQDYGSALDSNSHTGTYAAVIWTWYTYVTGNLYYGANSNPLMDWVYGGNTVVGKPQSLRGWYQYDLAGTTAPDSAVIKVLLKKWNTTTNQMDSVGYGEMKFSETAAYTEFDIPIIDLMPGVMPDSVAIHVASRTGTAMCTNNDCHYFYLDDLNFSGPTGIQPIELQKSPAYPNPTTGLITVSPTHASSLQILDVTGQIIQSIIPNNQKTIQLDLSGYPKGVYFIRYNHPNYQTMTEQVLLR